MIISDLAGFLQLWLFQWSDVDLQQDIRAYFHQWRSFLRISRHCTKCVQWRMQDILGILLWQSWIQEMLSLHWSSSHCRHCTSSHFTLPRYQTTNLIFNDQFDRKIHRWFFAPLRADMIVFIAGDETLGAKVGYGVMMTALYAVFPGIYPIVAAAVGDATSGCCSPRAWPTWRPSSPSPRSRYSTASSATPACSLCLGCLG